MKLFKKLLCFCALTCLALGIGFGTSALNSDDKSSAVSMTPEAFEYVTFSRNGQKLGEEHLKFTDDTTYIVANESITMTLKPMKYRYEFTADPANFIISSETIKVLYDTENDKFPDTFEYRGTTYYFRHNEAGAVVNIYLSDPVISGSPPITTTDRNNAITYTYIEDTEINITIVDSITLKSEVSDIAFTFSINDGMVIKTYTVQFLRPVVQFANAQEPIVRFTCNGLDAGYGDYVENIIPNELDYNSVQIDFLNNNYSEFNPLYFEINYNGFVYTFELYSKIYDSVNYLFVNYIDEVKTANNQYLATGLSLNQNQELELDTNHLINAFNGADTNEFSLCFTKTGRYEIKIYDSTYLYGFANPNFMKTSFYIKDKSKSNFENIYIIAQTQENDGTDIEYIVSTSTLNKNVKVTIKNLDNFAKVGGEPVTLADVIEKIEVKKTTFGGSTNIPTPTDYFPEDIEDDIFNGDLTLKFDTDAYYQITIYQKNSTQTIYYDFTIVKHAKTTFTVPLVDENSDPIIDPVTNRQKTDTYEATVPYRTEVITYTMNILSSMNLNIKYKSSGDSVQAKHLGKTYTNIYTISYGVQAVILERYELIIKDGSEETVVPGLHLRVYGVGDITLDVTYNGVTTSYTLNSEIGQNTISFYDYGSYTVKMVDSMGTQTAGVYKYSKKLNTSALALILLSSLLVLIILVFVLVARGKIKTR